MSLADTTILEAASIPDIWRPWFRDPSTWAPWFTFLRALFGLPMSSEERRLYAACTGREERPEDGVREAWLVCGRRAGKSFVLALIAAYLAVFKDWRPYLSPGEVGTIKACHTCRCWRSTSCAAMVKRSS